tara:strand:- start:541 stop:771 length:231 start_codon:yes stop_codon:yes gene_type:complete
MHINRKYLNKDINFEIISKLKHENKYLREILEEEKKKLTDSIKVLKKEIENIKEDNRILNNEVLHFEKVKTDRRTN